MGKGGGFVTYHTQNQAWPCLVFFQQPKFLWKTTLASDSKQLGTIFGKEIKRIIYCFILLSPSSLIIAWLTCIKTSGTSIIPVNKFNCLMFLSFLPSCIQRFFLPSGTAGNEVSGCLCLLCHTLTFGICTAEQVVTIQYRLECLFKKYLPGASHWAIPEDSAASPWRPLASPSSLPSIQTLLSPSPASTFYRQFLQRKKESYVRYPDALLFLSLCWCK